jgi:uncharacterized protein YdaU (DUF1376 family)
MADLNMMPLYTDAYLADTMHLSREDHGSYLLLLMAMWRAGGTLPNDPKVLARIAKVSPRQWHDVWKTLGLFFTVLDGDEILTQKKLSAVYRASAEKVQKNRQNGRRGGRPKQLKPNDPPTPTGYGLVPQNQTQPQTERETETEPKPNLSVSVSESVSRKGSEDNSSLRSELSSAPSDVDGGQQHQEDFSGLEGSQANPTANGKLWARGLRIVCELTGKPEKVARLVVGTLLRIEGATLEIVLNALEEAGRERPKNPIPWTIATVKHNVAGAQTTKGRKEAAGDWLRAELLSASPRRSV